MEKEKYQELNLEPYNKGELGEGIFKQQRHLMQYYIDMGALPDNIDLNDRKDQSFIRGLAGYIVEEYCEAQEGLIDVSNAYLSLSSPEQLKKTSAHAIEEFADIIHFFVELMIYSGIDSEVLSMYIKEYCKQLSIESTCPDDSIHASIYTAKHLLYIESEMQLAVGLDLFDTGLEAGPLAKYSHVKDNHIQIISMSSIRYLYKSVNLLKSKEWRLDNVSVNAGLYKQSLVNAWLHLFSALEYIGFDPKSVYYHYTEKNKANIQRLKDKY